MDDCSNSGQKGQLFGILDKACGQTLEKYLSGCVLEQRQRSWWLLRCASSPPCSSSSAGYSCYIKILWRQQRCDRVMHWQEVNVRNRSRELLLFNACFLFTHREWQAKSNPHEKTQEKSHSISLIGTVTWKASEGELDFKERNSFPRPCGDKHCCALVNKSDKQIQDRFPCIQFGSQKVRKVCSILCIFTHASLPCRGLHWSTSLWSV